MRDAEEKGAALLTGPFRRQQNLIWPSVLDHVTADMRLAWEEVRHVLLLLLLTVLLTVDEFTLTASCSPLLGL